ncbi:hypothetical protein ACH4S8_40550 [Streptomyces sp. NPDC021080]|uniref:hypothetical protein n=1 Tax=Streptomyces sp. NPDC021080 TaxID=3365110 RepID=UPI0037AD7331
MSPFGITHSRELETRSAARAPRACRSPRLALRCFPLLTALLFLPGGLAAGEVGVPAGIADRLQQRPAVAVGLP